MIIGDFPLSTHAILIERRFERSHQPRWLFVADSENSTAMTDLAVDADVKQPPIQSAEHHHLNFA